MKTEPVAKNIDEYISRFPESVQDKLETLRKAILEAAPKSIEVISYGMPAFKQNGVLVFFAAYKNHIGFYPTGSGILEFESEFTKYKYSKGAVQFPIDKSLPIGLIKRIVKFRAKQDSEKSKLKKKSKIRFYMVEIFKTSVESEVQADEILEILFQNFPEFEINFDLEDCDKILRVGGNNIPVEQIISLILNSHAFCNPIVIL